MLIKTIYPSYINSFGNGYACQSIVEAMCAEGFDARLFCVSADNSMCKPFHRFAMPLWAKPIGYKLISTDLWAKYTEWCYRHAFKDEEIAYIWPGTSIETYRNIKSAGHILVTENINTHQVVSQEILDVEYRRVGLIPSHGIDERKVDDECAKLELVDYVFSPSQEVSKSLLKADVPTEKILNTSYGLRSIDILSHEDVDSRSQGTELTAIFVGSICIRKGAHLLLEYWVKAGVKGKLKLIGSIEQNARHLIEPYLNRHDIEHIPFTRDLRSVYSNADIFLFPSLEEGSPLVTYLALGAGLSCIVSPMGSGGVIHDGCEGLVIDPHDADGWIDSIRKLFSDAEYRLRIAGTAFNTAEEYLWSNVGRRRRELLLASIDNRISSNPS